VLMRVHSRCAHHLRPPLTASAGARGEARRPLAIGKPFALIVGESKERVIASEWVDVEGTSG
jgi:hypothetical protein